MGKLLHFALLGALLTGCTQEGDDLGAGDGDRADLLETLTCDELPTPTCYANPTGEFIVSCTEEVRDIVECAGTTTCQFDACGEGAQCCEPEDGCYDEVNMHANFVEQHNQKCGSGGGLCQECDTGDTCQQGQCVAEDEAYWTMSIDSAEVSPVDPDGNDWDRAEGAEALPDPYVIASFSGDLASLSEISSNDENELSPTWSDFRVKYLQGDLTERDFAINIRDADPLGGFEHIGFCQISITQEDLELGSMLIEECEGASNIRLSFTKSE